MHESFLVLCSFITFDMLRKCTFFSRDMSPLLIANSRGVRISEKEGASERIHKKIQ